MTTPDPSSAWGTPLGPGVCTPDPGLADDGQASILVVALEGSAEGWDPGPERPGDWLGGLTRWLRQNPRAALLLGLGLGFGLGFLLARGARL